MLRYDPRFPEDDEDPQVLGQEEWAMRQTPATQLAYLKFAFDWDDAAAAEPEGSFLWHLIEDPETDIALIACILWSLGALYYCRADAHGTDRMFRRIFAQLEQGHYRTSKLSLHRLEFHSSFKAYLQLLETGTSLNWHVPHRLLGPFPSKEPQPIRLKLQPEERTALKHAFQDRDIYGAADFDRRTTREWNYFEDEQRLIGAVPIDPSVENHLAFVRLAAAEDGPVDLEAEMKLANKDLWRVVHREVNMVQPRFSEGSFLWKLRGTYHTLKMVWCARREIFLYFEASRRFRKSQKDANP